MDPTTKVNTDCRKCCRTFKSPLALLRHEKYSTTHAQPRVETTSKASTEPTPPALPSFTYRGNEYTLFSKDDQISYYHRLFMHIHHRSRLTLERFQLTPTATTTPSPDSAACNSDTRRRAIVLDCEMAGCEGQPDQVIAISAIDFCTAETLLNTLVEPPAGRITDWRSHVTGITPARMAAAVSSGLALRGTEEAVEKLFEVMHDATTLVGHSVRQGMFIWASFSSGFRGSMTLGGRGFSYALKAVVLMPNSRHAPARIRD